MDKIESGISQVVLTKEDDISSPAIMTTDTCPKEIA
jgi:N-acetylglutamate synthase/N-acetylornithine aminotransferase